MDWKDDIDIYRSALTLSEAIDGHGEQDRIIDLANRLAHQVVKSVEDDASLAGEFEELEQSVVSPVTQGEWNSVHIPEDELRPLQRLRREAGFRTAAEFAQAAGIPAGEYNRYERGLTLDIPVGSAALIAKQLAGSGVNVPSWLARSQDDVLTERADAGLEAILEDDGSVYQPDTGYLAVSYLGLSDPTIEVFRLEPADFAGLVERIRSERETSDISTKEMSSGSDMDFHISTFHSLDEFEKSRIGKGFLDPSSNDRWVDVSGDAKLDAYLASIDDKEAAPQAKSAERQEEEAHAAPRTPRRPETFCTINWRRDDIVSAIEASTGIHLDREGPRALEVEAVIDDVVNDVAKQLRDESIVRGWNVIDTLLPDDIVERAEAIVPEQVPEPGRQSVRDWYMQTYPSDFLGADIERNLTFDDALAAVARGGGFYDALGVGDSVVRERVFQELADRNGIGYSDIYEAWVDGRPVPVEPTTETNDHTQESLESDIDRLSRSAATVDTSDEKTRDMSFEAEIG